MHWSALSKSNGVHLGHFWSIPWIAHLVTNYLYKVITQSTALRINISNWAEWGIFLLLRSLCTRAKSFQAQKEIPQVQPGEVIGAFWSFVSQITSAVWRRVKTCSIPYLLRGEIQLLLPETFARRDAGRVTQSPRKRPGALSSHCRRVLGAAAATCTF